MDSEKITVKYFAQNEFCKEPYQASEDVAGYDLFAAETLTLFPEMNGCISLAFRFAIPKGFYGKIFPRSGLFKEYLITCDAGVLDPDFRGIVQVLMMNHHPEKTFMKKIWWKKAKKLIELVDWITDKHFVKKSILRQVGWCAQQL